MSYGGRRSGRVWLAQQEQKTPALRKDVEESVVKMNEPSGDAVGSLEMKKFEVALDMKTITPLAEVERRYIEAVIEELGGNKTKAAEALGIGRTTIYRKFGLRKN